MSTYNSFGRLIQESNKSLDKTYVYEYNESGNIKSAKTYTYTTDSVANLTATSTENYVYDSTVKDRLKSFNNSSISYDTSGYPTYYNNRNYTWTKGKLTRIHRGSSMQYGSLYEYCNFTYDGYGRRLSKSYSYDPNPGSTNDYSYMYTTTYDYDTSGRLIHETCVETTTYTGGSSSTRDITYLYDETGIVGAVQKVGSTESTFYFDKNIKGDVIGIYNSSGTRIANYSYDSWGNCTPKTLVANNFSTYNPIRYRGYYYDRETRLYYLNARYYDPSWRRFISPDKISALNGNSINGLNLYSYAGNSPTAISYGIAENTIDKVASKYSVRNPLIDCRNNILNFNYGHLDLDFLGNIFSFSENIYSTMAGITEGIRRRQGLGQYESLTKTSKVLMHVGFWLNIGLSAYNYRNDTTLSTQEKWVGFGIDSVYTATTTIGAYYLGMIPYVGPFLAIGIPIIVEYIWSGELNIFGFDIDVKPLLIDGMTLEDYVNNWVNSWFD